METGHDGSANTQTTTDYSFGCNLLERHQQLTH